MLHISQPKSLSQSLNMMGAGATTGDATSRTSSSAPSPSRLSLPPDPASPTSFSNAVTGGQQKVPRQNRAGTGGEGTRAGPQYLSKRRRRHGVTPTACTECRKKRAKCDGQRPCGRCRTKPHVQCVYEVPVRQSKDTLRTKIYQLRQRQRSSERVITALVHSELWQEVLSRLRGGQSVDVVSDWLGSTFPPAGGTVSSIPRPPDPGGALVSVMSSLSFTPGTVASVGAGLGVGSSLSSQSSAPPQSPSPPPLQQGHIQALRASWPEQGRHDQWNFSRYPQSGVSAASEYHLGLTSWTPDLSHTPSRSGSWVEDGAQPEYTSLYRWLYQTLSPQELQDATAAPSATWTNITADIDLAQHLLALYFCWEYPTFASLSKEHFLKDFKAGNSRYCSSMLVNALLALGCRFSTKPNTLADPVGPNTSGDHFFKESLRLYNEERNHWKLTTIQALGIMAIREAGCGRNSESRYYAGQSIRLAVEMGLHLNNGAADEDEVAVRAATFWGAFGLDHAWSLVTGSLPQCSQILHLPPKPAIIGDIESSLWVPYTDNGVPLQRSYEQLSNVRSVYKCFCELSELVHQSLYLLYAPGRQMTSRELVRIYTQFLDWYSRIPEALRLGHNFTPAVLFAHMYYHFAILLLFRPLIKLRIIGSEVSPRDVCSQAADAIQGLLHSYSQLHTLRRAPSFIPYFVLISTVTHMAIAASSTSVPGTPTAASQQLFPRAELSITEMPHGFSTARSAPSSCSDFRVTKAIRQGIAGLTEMAPYHHFAQQALNVIRYLAKKWNLDVDVGHRQKSEGGSAGNSENGAVKPRTASLIFTPNVQLEDVVCPWGPGIDTGTPSPRESEGEKAGSVQAGGEVLGNLLFWPFPLQRKPTLPAGQELLDAGFTFL